MGDMLPRIARTAALCGVLGLALYLALSWLAEFPSFAPGLALAGSVLIVALTCSTLGYALRAGVFPTWPAPVPRDRQPFAFWSAMAWTLLGALAGLALAVVSGTRLLETWLGHPR